MLTDNEARSCVCFAAVSGHIEVVKLLVDIGGRELLMVLLKDGSSCLSLAAEMADCEDNTEVVKVIEEAY